MYCSTKWEYKYMRCSWTSEQGQFTMKQITSKTNEPELTSDSLVSYLKMMLAELQIGVDFGTFLMAPFHGKLKN